MKECCGNPLRGCVNCPPPKKLSFEEWLRQSSFVEPDAGTYLWLKDCWQAAQKNMPDIPSKKIPAILRKGKE